MIILAIFVVITPPYFGPLRWVLCFEEKEEVEKVIVFSAALLWNRTIILHF